MNNTHKHDRRQHNHRCRRQSERVRSEGFNRSLIVHATLCCVDFGDQMWLEIYTHVEIVISFAIILWRCRRWLGSSVFFQLLSSDLTHVHFSVGFLIVWTWEKNYANIWTPVTCVRVLCSWHHVSCCFMRAFPTHRTCVVVQAAVNRLYKQKQKTNTR